MSPVTSNSARGAPPPRCTAGAHGKTSRTFTRSTVTVGRWVKMTNFCAANRCKCQRCHPEVQGDDPRAPAGICPFPSEALPRRVAGVYSLPFSYAGLRRCDAVEGDHQCVNTDNQGARRHAYDRRRDPHWGENSGLRLGKKSCGRSATTVPCHKIDRFCTLRW